MAEGLDIIRKKLDEMSDILQDPAFMQELLDELDEMWNMMNSKGNDYAGNDHTWTSFERQNALLDELPEETEAVFIRLVVLKIARLIALVKSQKVPNHESVIDSWRDLANYIVLFVTYFDFLKEGKTNEIRSNLSDPALT